MTTSPIESWDEIAEWWRSEVADDPLFDEQVRPLLDELLPREVDYALDLGCGEGRLLPLLARRADVAVGVEEAPRLARWAVERGPVVRAILPRLDWVRDGTIALAVAVYVLDLLDDAGTFFVETARVVRPGGFLVVVVNHPVFTPDDAAPVVDADGEVLWRWGGYFATGVSDQPAGERTVRFHHRPLGVLLTEAAQAGWCLETLVEVPLGPGTVARHPGYRGQEQIPRILAVRWRRTDSRNPPGTPM
ncbi:MAG TPA: class I SAM-dependent methyltransferase [Actinobacteria bacterium]|nr:class I SAM-dependent methyltransferase [Actinomycetota bacterium]